MGSTSTTPSIVGSGDDGLSVAISTETFGRDCERSRVSKISELTTGRYYGDCQGKSAEMPHGLAALHNSQTRFAWAFGIEHRPAYISRDTEALMGVHCDLPDRSSS